MATGKAIVLTNNVVTIAGFALTLLLVGGGAMWNLRGFIASEIERATAAATARLENSIQDTNRRLEAAVADIQQEIRAGRESTDRQMAEIRQFIFDLYSDDDPEAEDARDDADSPD
jgi:C4-dicarboxylate-specific signal transduction histidine kinase